MVERDIRLSPMILRHYTKFWFVLDKQGVSLSLGSVPLKRNYI